MNKYLTVFLLPAFILLLSVGLAEARSDFVEVEVKKALTYKGKQAIDSTPFFLKGQSHASVAIDLGVFRSNKRTNAFNKDDEHACSIAFQSAIITLQSRAKKLGADGIIDIYSVTKDKDFESPDKFQCAAGSFVANVALSGRMVIFGADTPAPSPPDTSLPTNEPAEVDIPQDLDE